MQRNTCTLLGTGTSQGVPIIGCKCEVCISSNAKDKRLRTSAFLQINQINIVIDVGPDFRQQMLVNEIDRVDAVLITHQHNDHIIGLDDVRPYNFMQRHPMPIYASREVIGDIVHRFDYAFAQDKYPGAPSFETNTIDVLPFMVGQTKIIPIKYLHGAMTVRGFRINNFAYVTDIKTIDDQEIEKLKGLSNLVLSALHHTEHHSHFNLKEALAFIEILQPKQTYLTHLSHRMGLHDSIFDLLPHNVSVGYDGLKITMD